MAKGISQALAIVAAIAATAGAHAAYPDRAVTIVVPFSAGTATDGIARSFGEALSSCRSGSLPSHGCL